MLSCFPDQAHEHFLQRFRRGPSPVVFKKRAYLRTIEISSDDPHHNASLFLTL